MSNIEETRKKAQAIVDSDGVVVVTPDMEWNVRGTKDTYSVTTAGSGLYCERIDRDDKRRICPSWQFMKDTPQEDRYCKHTEAVRIKESIRR